MRRRRRWPVPVAAILVAALAAGAWWLLRPRPESPEIAGAALATAWSNGSLEDAPFTVASPSDVADRYAALVGDLQAGPPQVELVAAPLPSDDTPEETAATLSVTWDLGVGDAWTYQTTAGLELVDLEWHVAWDPSIVHPRLADGLTLRRDRLRPHRGDVLAADGTPIVTDRPVVHVGVQPSRVQDVAELAATLADVLDIDGEALVGRIESADPEAFVAVITLRRDDYDEVRDQIRDLPGTVFREDELPLAPTREFARAILGRAGPVTAELLEANPDRYSTGDIVGLSGLQAAYDEYLFGMPGLRVRLVGEQAPEGDDAVLFEVAPTAGGDVTITMDERIQRIAEDAVAGTGYPAALVALRISDGHVLAAANSTETGGFNLAFGARVAPGSTFKIVTTAALFRAGITPDQTVPCPDEVVIGGKQFTNAEGDALGDVPFRTAFVNSCNTAFASLSQELAPDALAEAATDFGLGLPLPVGLDTNPGEVPTTDGPVDLAATAIGQGRITASPLAMAGVPATVARGEYRPPSFVLTPEPDAQSGAPPSSATPLGPQVVASLQALTRQVVAEGTGTAAGGVPGEPLHGKTGTAEYGEEVPPRTHAWFVGYQGDMAFAVLVAETESAFGGELAAPIAARFLTALAS